MIKAELNYNPYLLETTVKFNGQAPRINSLVEKYQNGSLQKWVRMLPDIFHDEMNGYDFELEFSGTKSDFQEVVDAFRKKGVSEELVRIFHKNELEGRYEKSQMIDRLMLWLSENQNRNFDFEEFKRKYADLFDGSYVYIVFQGSQLLTGLIDVEDISIEHVDSTDELATTELKNTPILFYLSKDNINAFQKNLMYFLKREDVENNQLFFLIHPALDAGKVERIIVDLGIAEPNIVTELFDPAIKKYIELYPVSDYVFSVVSLFRYMTYNLSERLKVESEKCANINREVHSHIDRYEDTIARLKEAYHNFINRDNIEIPSEWNALENELLSAIDIWRKRKTKITDESEAMKVANDFEVEVRILYSKFLEAIVEAAKNTKQEIDLAYETIYKKAAFDDNYQVTTVDFSIPELSEKGISISYALMNLVEEKYVQPKDDIFGHFFKATSASQKDSVLQRTYYYQTWRDCVRDIIRPKEKETIRILFEQIKKYESELSGTYIIHLYKLISEQTRLKEQEAAKLSDEEQLLQSDIDWLVKVQDQLKAIARG